MSEQIQTQVAAANQDPTVMQGALAESVQAMLNDESIKHLMPHEQGMVILDRFVGELVGKEPIESSQGAKTASEILGTVDMISRDAHGPQAFAASLRTITRTEGLRQAVFMLAGDARTGQLFGQFGSRLFVKDGQPTLRSVNQLDGYLSVKAPEDQIQNASNWRDVIRDEVVDYATRKDVAGRWDTRHLMDSEVGLVRQGQQEWEAATDIAQSAGVDMELVQRTAEEMRSLVARGQFIGDLSMRHSTDNYDQLLR